MRRSVWCGECHLFLRKYDCFEMKFVTKLLKNINARWQCVLEEIQFSLSFVNLEIESAEERECICENENLGAVMKYRSCEVIACLCVTVSCLGRLMGVS